MIMFLNSFAFPTEMLDGDLNDEKTAVNWYNIEEVQSMAKEAPKDVFIDFTAKWCGWCKVMDKKTFSDQAVAKYINENYYAVKVDFDSEQRFEFLGKEYDAKAFARKYNVTGLPTILFASSDFETVVPVVGYQNAKQFMTKLKKFSNR